MRRVAVVMAVFCMLVAGACGGGGSTELEPLSGLPSQRPPTSDGQTAAAGGREWQPLEIEVLHPGSEPRRELRLTPEVGTEYHVRTYESASTAITTMTTSEVTEPPYETDSRVTVVDVANGAITLSEVPLTYRIHDDGFDARLVRDTRDDLDREIAKGPEVRTLTDRGQLLRAVYRDRPSAEPASSPDLSPPLPADAVGVGARYRWGSVIPSEGIDFVLDAEVELVSIDDGVVTGTISMTMTGPPGQMDGGHELIASEMRFTGTVTWHLRLGAPLLSLEATGEMHMRSAEGGVGVEVKIRQTMALRQHLLG